MIKITKNIEEANMITHTGSFHPDDVFSTAFLSKITENPTVIRVPNMECEHPTKITYDIGFGKFDHHGTDARFRSEPHEKNKYCSFGLLWETFSLEYLKKIVKDDIDYQKLSTNIIEKYILQIDAIDNGLFPKIEAEYSLTDLDKVIDLFNKNWNEDIDNDNNFITAVNIASQILERIVKREASLLVASKIIEEKINTVENNILFLDEYIPYQEAVFKSTNELAKSIKIVIFPSNRGGYNIKPMTISQKSKELVVNFPEHLRGLHDEELAEKSNIPGARFIHLSGFLAATDTLESAYELAKLALNNNEEKNE